MCARGSSWRRWPIISPWTSRGVLCGEDIESWGGSARRSKVFQCSVMRYSFQAVYPTRSQQSLKQPDRGTCPESVGAMQATSELKSSRVVRARQAVSSDRHCSGQEKCLAELVDCRQLQKDGWPGSVGVQLARWCGWWRGEVNNSSDESSSSSRGGPLGRWLSPGSSLALGPLWWWRAQPTVRAEGRNLGSRAAAAAEMEME